MMRTFAIAALACVVVIAAVGGMVAMAQNSSGPGVGKPAAAETASKAPARNPDSPYAQWKRGPSTDPNFFPIGVWCQSPRNAPKYKAIGVTFYLALWGGPTEQELADLKKYDMPVICDQNEVGLKHLNDPIIIGWMHGDEPDNMKQENGKWVPVAKPEQIVADYQRWRKADPSRPVLLNLGQGVANDGYKGSWVRDQKIYADFLKGCDIASYDIYPIAGARPETDGKLELVPLGVDRLQKWGGPKKIVWNIVECTRISSSRKPTPEQVRSQVWMCLIHGSNGIVYFCHEFKPNPELEYALLKDEEMAAAVGKINKQILELAPVLNSPTLTNVATVSSSNSQVPVHTLVKKLGDDYYVFAAAMANGETRGSFRVSPVRGPARAEVLGEDRTIEANGGSFTDEFKPYGVHLYKITPAKPAGKPE